MLTATHRSFDKPVSHPARRTWLPRAVLVLVGGILLSLGVSGAALAQTTYTWVGGAGPAAWTTSTNWSPVRATPATNDIMVISSGGSVTINSVPIQTIGQLLISGSTAVTLQASATTTLTVGNGAGVDLDVPAGSALNLGTTSTIALTISLPAGATGNVAGSMTLTGGTGNATHQLVAADAGAITFASGAVFTQGPSATGNAFASTGTAGTIVFQSGATFVSRSGSNPFGLPAPNSKVNFQAGSTYRHEQTGSPSFSGRTYPNYVHHPGSGTITGSGGGALSIDNLTVTTGTLNFGMTGTFNIKGNILVGSGATLGFTAGSAATVTLSGTSAQTITNNGTLTINSTETLAIANASGVSLGSNVTTSGNVSFTSTGKLSTGAFVLAINSPGNTTGAGSGSGWVVGNLRTYIPSGSSTRGWDIGSSTAYTPVVILMNGNAAAFDLTVSTTNGDHPSLAASDLDPAKSVNRYYTLTPSTTPTFTDYTAAFNFDAADVDGAADPAEFWVRKHNGSSWQAAGTPGARTPTSTQTTGLTSFSDFAVAELLNWTITASAGAGGSISPSGAVTVANHANQSFTITPNLGFAIQDVLVDGSSVGAVGSYTFTDVTTNHTIAASFVAVNYTITATAGANGSITPSGAVSVGSGGNQSFTIAADPNYHILDVLVDGSSVGPVTSYTFTNVQANHTIDASFAIDTYTITASAGPNGSIAPSGATTVPFGGSQGYTITPDPNYHVLDVLVDGSSVGPVTSYTFSSVSANHTIDASFAINTYPITATAGAGGSIAPSGVTQVPHGGSQGYTITPNTGYHVLDVLVDGSSVGAVTGYTFTNVTASHTIDASFAINTYTIVATAGAGGSIAPSGTTTVNYGDNQTYTITPNVGYAVLDVLVDGVSVGSPTSYTFTNVTANHTIDATFATNTFPITATAGPNGQISPSGTVNVTSGGNQTFTITPDTGYHVDDVLVDGSSVGPVTSYTFTNVTASHTIDASFAINTYTITATAGPNGSIAPPGVTPVNYNGSVSYTITPNTGYHVLDVLVDGSSVGAVTSYTFSNVTANHTIDASFAINVYTITASAAPNGSIAPSGAVPVTHGADASFTITPDPNYQIADVLVDGSSVGPVGAYTFFGVTTHHTIAASFSPIQYTLMVTIVGNGTVSRAPDQPTYNAGSTVQLAATAEPGWHFSGWSGDASGSTSPTSVLMDGNKSVTATFLQNIYTWNQSGSASWTTAANWTPTRTTPQADDVLLFNSGVTTTATGVPAQTIGQLLISGSTNVSLQPGAANNLLTIAGGSGTDFEVQAGSTLNLNAATALRIGLGAAATGGVGGTINATGAAHRLLAVGGNALVFQGGSLITVGTGFSGNVFGQGANTVADPSALLSVRFDSGSIYAQTAGSNPFGASQPNSVVTFLAGSRFRLDGALTPSFSGRTYADFEHNTAGPTTTTGGNALKIDNFIVTQGVMNCNMTGVFNLKGDVTVNAGATLNFNAAAPATITLSGTTTQTFTANGILTAAANETFDVANPAGVALASGLNLNGGLKFTTGKVTTGPFVLSVLGSGTITGAGAGTGYVVGNLRRTVPLSGSQSFPIGDAGAYTPVSFAASGVGSTWELTARTDTPDHALIGLSGIDPSKSVNRTWTLAQGGSASFTSYDATFAFVAADVDGGANTAAFGVWRYDGAWNGTGTGTRTATSTQATGVTGFGDFAIGELNQYTLNVTIVGNGTVTRTPDQPTYDAGTPVTLGATPGSGWSFAGWSGDTTTAANPIVVTMDGNKNITATFVDVAAPTVTVTFPNGGENLLVGSDHTLTWTATDNDAVTTVTLAVSRDEGVTWTNIAVDIPHTGSYLWTVTSPGTNTGIDPVYTCLFRVTAKDAANNSGSDASDALFSIYDLATEVVVTRLEAVTIDEGVAIKWAFSNATTLTSITVERSEAEVGPWAPVETQRSEEGGATVAIDRTVAAGRVYWYRLVGATATGLRAVFGPIAATSGAPKEFALGSPWPNPSRGPVQLDFSVAREANVRLIVLDLQGREVETLADGNYSPGRYRVSWDGRTSRGTVPAGVYFVRYQVPGKTVVKRFSLAR